MTGRFMLRDRHGLMVLQRVFARGTSIVAWATSVSRMESFHFEADVRGLEGYPVVVLIQYQGSSAYARSSEDVHELSRWELEDGDV